jgi:hypothetical protein
VETTAGRVLPPCALEADLDTAAGLHHQAEPDDGDDPDDAAA